MSNEFNPEFEKPELENLRDLVDGLIYRLPGCDLVMIRKTMQEVYRDFCKASCVLNSTRTIDSTEDDIYLDSYFGEIESVSEVFWNDKKLTPGRDYKVVGRDMPILRMHKSYKNGKLKIICVEIPSIGDERVPRWFLRRYGDAIISGTLARLMTMTGKAWTDASQGSYHWALYENAKNEARNRYYQRTEFGNGDLGFAIDTGDLI